MAPQFPVTEWSWEAGAANPEQVLQLQVGSGFDPVPRKGLGGGRRQTGSIAVPLAAFRAFLAMLRDIPHRGSIMRQPRAPHVKGAGQRNLLMEEERRAPAQLSTSPCCVKDAQEKAPFPAQISPSPTAQLMQPCTLSL